MVKNPPANAGDTGSLPDPGRSHKSQSNEAHSPRLLSLCSRAWKLQLLSLMQQVLKSTPPQWETRTVQLESSPHLLQLEKSPCSNEMQYSQNIKNNNKLKC